MMKAALHACLPVLLVSFSCIQSAAGLDIELDSMSGSVTIVDNDVNDLNPALGVIDFNQAAIGGVFNAEGRAVEEGGPIGRFVNLTATPPAPNGIFRNIGGGTPTFTVTINTSSFAPVGTPLGWFIGYQGSADDPTLGSVDIPSHSVSASINAGTVPLGIVAGTAITMADGIELFERSSNLTDDASDIRVVFTFQPGPDDEILLPDITLGDTDAISVVVFDQLKKCIDQMNFRAGNVAKAAARSDAYCVRHTDMGSSATACIDGPDPRADSQEQKLLDKFAFLCTPQVPSWGVNGCAACISQAARQGVNDMVHDILVGPGIISVDRETARCQAQVVKRAGDVFSQRWKSFRKCKKTNIGTITDDPLLVAACLGFPQDDPMNFTMRETKLAQEVDKCIQRGVTPIGPTAFPGAPCATAGNAAFADCLKANIACRFCLAVSTADDIDAGALNCDAFDGGFGNGCPPTP